MPVFNNILAGAAGQAGGAAAAFTLEKSVRINEDDSAFLSRTFGSGGNRRTFTISFWLKRHKIDENNYFIAARDGTNYPNSSIRVRNSTFGFYWLDQTSSVNNILLQSHTTAVFRDPSAWYHFVIATDTTQATESDRVKLYVNGAQVTLDGTFPSQNFDCTISDNIQHTIGRRTKNTGAYEYGDGYFADYHYIDGSALDPTSFGAFDDNNVWQAAAYSGTYGTNGFHLFDFANESTVGHDSSGNENDFTANNISTSGSGTDILFDVPTNGDSSDDTGAGGEVSGNYCTLNPLVNAGLTLSNGNLDFTSDISNRDTCIGTLGVSSGKWYWEYTVSSNNYSTAVGIEPAGFYPAADDRTGRDSLGYAWHIDRQQKWHNGSNSSYGASVSSNAVIGVALDLDSGSLTFYLNGSTQGAAYTGISGTYLPSICDCANAGTGGSSGTGAGSMNFGQRPFAYTAPSNYKALCTTNLPTPTIADGSAYFDTKLYTGTGSSQSITGLEFSPDLVWLKKRNGATSHQLTDTVRGATKFVRSNTTGAEVTDANTLSSFNSDGFTVGSDPATNGSSDTFVSWNWDAGSSNTSITAGSLNSSAYDQSQTWSSTGTSTNTSSVANAFDGNLASYWASNANSISRYTFASVYSGTKFEIRLDVSLAATGFSVNGQSSNSVTGAMGIQWVDVTDAVTASNLGGLSYIEISYVPAQYSTSIYGVRIDGKLLVDSGLTVANVPSIVSTCRANQSSGFSIVSYTGSGSAATVGHRLNAAPEMIILKDRNSAQNWKVLHVGAVTASYPNHYQNLTWLNSNLPTTSTGTGNGYPWNNTAPTSSVFSVSNSGNNYSASESSVNYIAYCFAPVAGYSAFGSYEGNGSTNGPFVYTGFRPKFILFKNVDATGDWKIYDGARDPDNIVTQVLSPNSASAELFNTGLDFLANGFKWRDSGSAQNGNGNKIMYAAFAENPFQANGGLAR
jgi:hypothetical protein